jgi:hypothetical protein
MRWSHISFVFVAAGAVACTALLGDFSVNDGATGPDGSNSDGSSGGTEGGVVNITPPDAKMGILRQQTFTATEPVTWSVQEGDAAGTIDANGNYNSGPTPATYHIVATAKSDPTRKATVPIVVTNLAIGIAIGQNGGQGNIDGIPSKAHFNSPGGVAHLYDNSGGGQPVYFIADSRNSTIRMYDQKAGKVSTIAGMSGQTGTTNGPGATALFNQPQRLAMDSSAKKLYVMDNQGSCIRMIDVSGAPYTVSTLSGTCGTPGNSDGTAGTPPTVAQFNSIRSFAISGDKHSALYVCDGGNRLRRVELTVASSIGVTKDVFAGGLVGGCAPLAVDYFSGGASQKRVWIADNSSLRRFTEPASVASIPYATAAVAGLGTVVVTMPDFMDDFTIASGFGGDDDLYASNNNKSIIYRYHGVTSASATSFDATPWAGAANDRRVIDGDIGTVARIAGPQQLDAFPEYGKLEIADANGDAIREVTTFQKMMTTPIGAAHIVDRIDGPKATARITGPFSVAADDTGIIYFGDINFDSSSLLNSTIRKYDRTAATLSTLTGVPTAPLNPATPPTDGPKDQARFWFPIDVNFAKGKLFVIDNVAEAVRQVDIATGTVSTIAGELGVAGNSEGVGVAAHFKFVDLAGGSGGSGAGILAGSVTNDGTNLYVTDAGNFSIRKIVIATGETSTIAGGTQGPTNGTGKAAQFVFPMGLTFDNGNLYIADWQDHTIRRMNLATGVVDGFIGLSGQAGDKDGDAATATLNSPYRVVADGLGSLYVAELPLTAGQPNGVIRRIDIAKRSIGAFAGTPGQIGLQPGQLPSTLNCPTSLALLPKHDLAFGDFCDATIAVFQPL